MTPNAELAIPVVNRPPTIEEAQFLLSLLKTMSDLYKGLANYPAVDFNKFEALKTSLAATSTAATKAAQDTTAQWNMHLRCLPLPTLETRLMRLEKCAAEYKEEIEIKKEIEITQQTLETEKKKLEDEEREVKELQEHTKKLEEQAKKRSEAMLRDKERIMMESADVRKVAQKKIEEKKRKREAGDEEDDVKDKKLQL